MLIIIFVTALIIHSSLYAQVNRNNRSQENVEYVLHENGQRIRPADFKGGYKGWAKYLKKNLRYPKDAKEKGIQGKVSVQFIIDATGKVVLESVKVVGSLHESCDLEAVRLIKESPPWVPMRNLDERTNIESQRRCTINFRLK